MCAARMLVSFLVIYLCLVNQAKAASCGSVKHLSGDTCENLSYELDLSGCENPKPVVKPKVVCSPGYASISATTNRYSYRARFKVYPESSGSHGWTQEGDVQQSPNTDRRAVAAVASVAKPSVKPVAKPAVKKSVANAAVKPAPMPTAEEKPEAKPEVRHELEEHAAQHGPASEGGAYTVARVDPPHVPEHPAEGEPPHEEGANAPTDSSTRIHGFVDAQYKYIRGDSYNSGAVINDGAIYISHKKANAELFIDLPFAWEKLSNRAIDVDGDGQSNAFIVGRNKPQAYVAYTMGNTKVQLGQFDTIYGFEVNDAPDITFSSQGLIFNRILPLTHTGFMVTQTMGSAIFKGLAANASNEGGQVNRNGEYGGQLSYSSETLRAGVGVLMGSKPGGRGDENRIFTDLLLGGTFGKLVIDMEYSLLKEPGLNQGTAFLFNSVYNFSKQFSAALRYEYLDHIVDPAFALPANSWQITPGVQYQLTDALRLKVDFSFLNDQIDGGGLVEGRFGAVSAVYKF